MFSKTVIIVSSQVDATIKEYQPDVDFRIFKSVEDLGNYLDKNPLRAQTMFVTKDVIGGANTTFTYLRKIVTENDYMSVDNVVYITEENSEELESLNYLIDEFHLSNWEIITGSMTRAFITEIINGTFRGDRMSVQHKAVYRRPRAEYVKSKLKTYSSMDEEYQDDEHDLSDIPDEEVPELPIPDIEEHLDYVYIAGLKGYERTAFAFIAAQYLSLTEKTIIVESDPEYHTLTEFATKSNVDATYVPMTMLYDDPDKALSVIRNSEKKLVVVSCVDRIDFDYKYICQLLYYNLVSDFTYFVCETDLSDISQDHVSIVTVPSTVIDVLATGEKIDKSLLDNCRFIGINLCHLPEIHINSGVVVSTLLSDILSTQDIICPVVTLSSLRLHGSAYDLGGVLERRFLK